MYNRALGAYANAGAFREKIVWMTIIRGCNRLERVAKRSGGAGGKPVRAKNNEERNRDLHRGRYDRIRRILANSGMGL